MAAVGSVRAGTGPAGRLRATVAALAFALLAAMCAAPGNASGAEPGAEAIERQVKAAYLSKFAGYIEWPPQAFANGDSPIVIGILGDEGMAADVAQMVAGRSIQGRPVRVLALKRDEAVAGLHMLFIGRGYGQRMDELLASARGAPLLTVTEADDGLARGGMINFVVIGGRVRFEVAYKAAASNSVRVSARLLAAASRVTGAPNQ